MEETKFDRSQYMPAQQTRRIGGEDTTAAAPIDKPAADAEAASVALSTDKKSTDDAAVQRTATASGSVPVVSSDYAKKSYLARLKPLERINLRKKNQLPRLMGRPFYLLTFPIIVFAGFLYGCNIVWLSLLNATESMVLSNNPYNMTTSQVGLTFIAPLVGTTLA